ncbi:MAG: hypothetical protein DHS80DRAFT_25445 [Piptocephalis tieghemiana]|nr:MAG: hypothetical protein DHS80DRAFT_25445 [Piptocephalis tieghemiana]
MENREEDITQGYADALNYGSLYDGLFFMIRESPLMEKDPSLLSLSKFNEISNERYNTPSQYESDAPTLDTAFQYHAESVSESCKAIPPPVKSQPMDLLLLRSPNSLIDILCDAIIGDSGGRGYANVKKIFYRRLKMPKGPSKHWVDGKTVKRVGTGIQKVKEVFEESEREREVKLSFGNLQLVVQSSMEFLVLSGLYQVSIPGAPSMEDASTWIVSILNRLFARAMKVRLDALKGDGMASSRSTPSESRHASLHLHSSQHHSRPPSPAQRNQQRRLSSYTSNTGSPQEDPSSQSVSSYPYSALASIGIVSNHLSLIPKTLFEMNSVVNNICLSIKGDLGDVLRRRGITKYIARARNAAVERYRKYYFEFCGADGLSKVVWKTNGRRDRWIPKKSSKSLSSKEKEHMILLLNDWIYKVRLLKLIRYFQPALEQHFLSNGVTKVAINNACKKAQVFTGALHIQLLYHGIQGVDGSKFKDMMYGEAVQTISDVQFVTGYVNGAESPGDQEEEVTGKELKYAKAFHGKLSLMLMKLRVKLTHQKANRETAWSDLCRGWMMKVLRQALDWASTPLRKANANDTYQKYARYAASLKVSLLEEHAGRNLDASELRLLPKDVMSQLSKGL